MCSKCTVDGHRGAANFSLLSLSPSFSLSLAPPPPSKSLITPPPLPPIAPRPRPLSCVNSRSVAPPARYLTHTTASLNVQYRQVNCLDEMAPTAPSRRTPRNRVEFDGIPGHPKDISHTLPLRGTALTHSLSAPAMLVVSLSFASFLCLSVSLSLSLSLSLSVSLFQSFSSPPNPRYLSAPRFPAVAARSTAMRRWRHSSGWKGRGQGGHGARPRRRCAGGGGV